jgi:tetratricopeptide (TPR) repeat protein
VATASALARQALALHADSPDATADRARAEFILARAAILSGRPEEAIDEFQQTLASSKDPRLLSWSHIYLGRMLDLDCKREQAVAEYKEALRTRDGQQDTRLAAERGIQAAYAVNGHSCEEDAGGESLPGAVPAQPPLAKSGDSEQKGSENPR